MPEFALKTPQLKYVAGLLEDFATKYGVPTSDEAIHFEQQTAPDQVRRHGHAFGESNDRVNSLGIGHEFQVGEIAKSIPLLLGRLALYERGHHGSREGVRCDEVMWLRLANIRMDDPRVNDILAIVSAHRTPNDAILLDYDSAFMIESDGNVARQPVPYSLHPFAGEGYDIRVSQSSPMRMPHLAVTSIDFALPDVPYVSISDR